MATYSGSDKRIKYLFENGGGGGSSSLAGLSDVNLSSPTDGQVLTYDNGEWVNGEGGSGGSGGAVYTETELWSNSSGATAGTVTLSDNISHYDMLVFETSNSGVDETVHSQVVVPVSMIDTTGTNAFGATNVGGGENYVQLFRYVSDTSISLAWWTGAAPLKYYKIIGIKISPEVIYLPTIYSEEEREVGVWTDGKPLYQKTSLVSISTGTNTLDTITNGENIRIVEAFAIYNDIQLLNLNYFNSSNDSCVIYTNQNTVYCVAGSSFAYSYTKVLFTIQYTKTTDTAGSGSWTPSGTPAVHYSLTEQVVGTWVDGSTLYERTYFLDNISSSATEYVVDNSFGNNKTMHSMDVQFSGMTNTLGKYINSISDTLYVDSGVLKYYIYKTDSWWNALNSCYITIRYTKSS